MTKQDILNLKTAKEIMSAILAAPELADKEINEHLKKIATEEKIKIYGSADFMPATPNKRKLYQKRK